MELIVLILCAAGVLLCAGAVGGFYAGWRADRRRLTIMTERLLAEQRLDAATHATLVAMRAAVRPSHFERR